MDVTDTSYAEGRILDFDSEDKIRADLLETFPYEGPRQNIEYETAEFSAVCPYSGLPDYATLRIEYVPGEVVVELKSLKYYIVSYRNVGIFQENATKRIYQDLWELLKPQRLCVTTEYNTRGGIDSICEIDSDFQG
ncbi:MAG: preQ(1) synthase [Deltaproteobacteria bacterium]|nr:preQ(1) synthase [Deltaproteobacteria bacterium]